MFSISIVSHNQISMIEHLLDDLNKIDGDLFEVILTHNIKERDLSINKYRYPLKIIKNVEAKGFGANHNAAFAVSAGNFFAVVNPDIRLCFHDFSPLRLLFEDPKVAVVAPMVRSPQGKTEDSFRKFPTLIGMLKRHLLKNRGPDYLLAHKPICVDWVAGMFMVFQHSMFQEIGGFDDKRFFMYLEDTDICRRLHEKGFLVKVQPAAAVVHNAQRASRRNLQHLKWHVTSALRYMTGL